MSRKYEYKLISNKLNVFYLHKFFDEANERLENQSKVQEIPNGQEINLNLNQISCLKKIIGVGTYLYTFLSKQSTIFVNKISINIGVRFFLINFEVIFKVSVKLEIHSVGGYYLHLKKKITVD